MTNLELVATNTDAEIRQAAMHKARSQGLFVCVRCGYSRLLTVQDIAVKPVCARCG
jgi:hypothetical protein